MKNLSEITIATSFLEHLLDYALHQGYDLSYKLVELNVSEEQLNDSFARIPFVVEDALLSAALEHTQDLYFGLHLGQTMRPRFMGALGYAAMSSAKLSDAIALLPKYHKLSSELADFEFSETDSTINIKWLSDYSYIDNYRHHVEIYFSAAISFGRWITGARHHPNIITFDYPAPEQDISEYKKIFGCPVLFNQPSCSIVLDKSLLNLSILESDPEILRIMTNRMEKQVSSVEFQGHIKDQVKRIIQQELVHGNATLEHVAESLNLKPWTLRRRLHKEEMDFSSLLDEVRQSVATQMLCQSDVQISDIAIDLGYSEQSAFNRAFKRWFNMTPAEYRKAHQSG